MTEPRFVNPYNFIPLTAKKKKAVFHNERNLSGVIEYSVLTKTPLFIPNTSNYKVVLLPEGEEKGEKSDKKQEHKSYDFFSYKNLKPDGPDEKDHRKFSEKPVIPGSEIRGMFRSNYEILTESCMSAVDDETVLSKRTAERFKPGLIRKNKDGTYDLLEARDFLWRTKGEGSTEDDLSNAWKDKAKKLYKRPCYIQPDFPEGKKVWFNDASKIDVKPERYNRAKPLACNVSAVAVAGKISGYIIKGEKGPVMEEVVNKHCCHIFQATKQNAVKRKISFDTLESVLREYSKNGTEVYGEYRKCFEDFKKNTQEEMFPVYYSLIHDYLMLSPACITREIYQTRLKDMLKTFRSCTNKESLCPACSLFGMVSKNDAVASRIRFTDLQVMEEESGDYYENEVTLAPLSSPKINNMEFYLKRPDHARFWTYDYFINGEDQLISEHPEISGRKFFWHQMNPSFPVVKKTNQNMTVRPVKTGNVFTGKLYFHNISKEEVDQLIWLLNAGEEMQLSDKIHGYKLGSAKPLGLGSIAVAVDRVLLRKTMIGEGFIERGDEPYQWSCRDELFEEGVVRNYRKMTDFHAVKGMHVSYPITEEQALTKGAVENGYEWFTKNHNASHKKGDAVTPTSRQDMYYKE